MDLTTYKIKDICDIRSGKRLPKGKVLSETPTEYMYIRARDIKDGVISLKDVAYIDSDTKSKIRKYIIEENDIAITIVANIGDIGLCTKAANAANLTENAVRLTSFRNEIVNPKYLAYYLSRPFMKQYMEGLATGAAQAKLGIYKIEKIKVELPPIDVQHNIVNFIEKFDKLIETHTEKIELLNHILDSVYKEWFVRRAATIDDNTYKLADLCDIISRGITPKYSDEGVLVINQKCIRDHSIDMSLCRYTQADTKIGSKKYVKYGDILINSTGTGTLGRTAIYTQAEELLSYDGHVTVVRTKENYSPFYIGFYLHSIEPVLENLGRGSTNQLELSAKDIGRLKIQIPTDTEKVRKFDDLAKKMYEEINVLESKICILQQQKSSLLLKLMSGKIDINRF